MSDRGQQGRRGDEEMTGGELLTRILAEYGIRTVFAVAGAGHTHLLDPLERDGVTIVPSRHESGAVGAADGYARTRGAPGVALIIAEQGLPNAVGALAAAWHAASPVLVIVASAPRTQSEADTAIDQDRLALVAPITKWARTVPSGERLADHALAALKHASSGRKGPAVLLVQEHLLSAAAKKPAALRYPAPTQPAPNAAGVAAAAAMLARARRPLIVAGGGAAWSNASAALEALSRDYGLPVLGNSLGRGQVAEDNRLSFAWPYAQMAACEADVVLVVGARLTQRLGMGLPPRFAAGAEFIQIDIDPTAFHRNRPVDIALHADAGAALTALHEALGEKNCGRFDTSWLHAALAKRKARIAEIVSVAAARIHPLTLGAAIMRRLPENVQIIGDGADIQNWMYGAIRIRRPRGFLDHYPLGAMGSGTALAVGAAAAHREHAGEDAPLTVLITGDGSIGFHPAEIHAAVRAGLKLIVIVASDGAWGTELHGQMLAIGRSVNTELGDLPYEKLGEAFGASGISISSTAELDAGLDRAFAANGVVVVNVAIDGEAGRELKTNPDVRMIVFSDLIDGQAGLSTPAAD